MKREFLQEFKVGDNPLPKEVIDAIMAENGRDIQKVKANFADYEDVKNQLAALQQDQSFEEAAKTWEEMYNQVIELHKQELQQMAFEKALGEGIVKAKGRNAKAITALLDVDTLKESEDQPKAIEEAIVQLQKSNGYLFGGEAAPYYARNTGAWQGAQENSPTTLAGARKDKFERVQRARC